MLRKKEADHNDMTNVVSLPPRGGWDEIWNLSHCPVTYKWLLHYHCLVAQSVMKSGVTPGYRDTSIYVLIKEE